MSEHANIYEALAAAYHDCGYVQKHKGKDGGVNYTYAGERAIIEEVRPALVNHGIVVFPTEIREIKRETYQTGRGATMNLIGVHVRYVFAHSSGTSIQVESYGEGADVGDKASGKALTGAYKYALRQALCIETGDDPDDSPSEEQERGKRPSNAAPPNPFATLGGALKSNGYTMRDVATVLQVDADTLRDEQARRLALEGWMVSHPGQPPVDSLIEAIAAQKGHGEGSPLPFEEEPVGSTQ